MLAEVDEALIAEEELTQDQEPPAVADQVERTGDRAVLIVALSHGSMLDHEFAVVESVRGAAGLVIRTFSAPGSALRAAR
jgi:hypothetical protein